MRTKGRSYRTHLFTFTQPQGAGPVGITEDFNGGDVLAFASFSTNIGVNNYVSICFFVDGIAQGAQPSFWQSGGNLACPISEILSVPQGRHRISIYAASNVAFPAGGCNAVMSVAELPG